MRAMKGRPTRVSPLVMLLAEGRMMMVGERGQREGLAMNQGGLEELRGKATSERSRWLRSCLCCCGSGRSVLRCL